MSEFTSLNTFTLAAAADLSNQQYHLVRKTTAGTCNFSSLATDNAASGILQTKPTAAGNHCTVADGGTSKVVAGAAITLGKHITCNGSGRAITVTSGSMAYGRAESAAGADGDIISVRLYVPVRWAGAP